MTSQQHRNSRCHRHAPDDQDSPSPTQPIQQARSVVRRRPQSECLGPVAVEREPEERAVPHNEPDDGNDEG